MKKKFSFWALMLAVALALSLVLTACGKKDDDKDDGGNTDGGGTTAGGQIALVDAEDLADKLFLMFTFEDADTSGKISAINPYTARQWNRVQRMEQTLSRFRLPARISAVPKNRLIRQAL